MLPDNNGICYCAAGNYGINCETQSCSPNPCKNNALCILNSSGVPKCLCTQSYTGTYCDKVL